jgi:Fe-Mn family superoxide dismutase
LLAPRLPALRCSNYLNYRIRRTGWPFLSHETLEFHHGKHHKAYVDKLNELVAGSKLQQASLEEIIKTTDGALFNNAGQHFNHSFY